MGSPAGRTGTVWREVRAAARFAAAVWERYRLRLVPVTGPVLEYRRPPLPPPLRLERTVQLWLAPRFTVVAPTLRETATVVRPELRIVHGWSAVARPATALQPATLGLGVTADRRARVIRSLPAPPLVLAAPVPARRGRMEQPVPAAEAVVAARRPRASDDAAVPRGVLPAAHALPAVDTPDGPASPTPASRTGEADLRRLTEQVISRIDQRIVARRERHGRP